MNYKWDNQEHEWRKQLLSDAKGENAVFLVSLIEELQLSEKKYYGIHF